MSKMKDDVLCVYEYLIISKNGKLPLKKLQEQFRKLGDIKSLLLSNQSFFWLEEDGESSEVRLKVDVKLCAKYTKGKCDGKCGKLHFCKEHLFSPKFCTSPCKNQLSHNINDNHNNPIINVVFPDYFTDGGQRIKVLRASFPRLCEAFKTYGKCVKEFCGYLHLCSDFIRGSCSIKCPQASLSKIETTVAHDISTPHNRKVFTSFKLCLVTNGYDEFFGNILIGGDEKDTFSRKLSANKPSFSKGSLNQYEKPDQKRLRKLQSTRSIDTVDETAKVSKNLKISLCYYYLSSKKNCEKGNCTRLHLCKKFLCGYCSSNPCQFSHDPFDQHNKNIIDRIEKVSSKNEAIKLIKKNLPQLCEMYLTSKCYNRNCKRVHLCKNVVLNEVCSVKGCNLSHSLTTPHNQMIARTRSYLIGKSPMKPKFNYFKLDIIYSKHRIKTPSQYMQRKCVNIKEINANGIIDESEQEERLLEEEIFNKILNDGGMAQIDDFIHYFENEKMVRDWFQEHSTTFRLVKEKDQRLKVYLCLSNVRPCFKYWSGDGCQSNDCDMFHICKKQLYNVKHSAITCKYEHNLAKLKVTAEKHNLSKITTDQLLMLLRTRFPRVCGDYLNNSCSNGESCPNVHLCGEFVEGRCSKSEGVCNFQHETGLRSSHTLKIVEDFHLNNDLNNIKNCLVYVEDFGKKSNTASKKPDVKVEFNPLKEEALCSKYINDLCLEGSNCKLRHEDPKSPFAWQYKEGGSWETFPPSININVEKIFSDPSNEKLSSNDVEEIQEALDIDFSTNGPIWKGNFKGTPIDVRRLSTKSSVLELDKNKRTGLTEWKWYWEFQDNDWKEYTDLVMSTEIEEIYLKNNIQHHFKRREFNYVLDFEKMEQRNLDPKYLTKRRVIRRPVFEVLDNTKTKLSFPLPTHWPEKIEKGKRIVLLSRQIEDEIRACFQGSVGFDVDVLSIEEICNEDFYTKYMNTKQQMIKDLGANNINEMSLYHGTSSNNIDAICVQNFDFRICGQQGVAYGHGSYFAREASYSNSFSKADAQGAQYMFLADVLVGKYTTGSSAMKRPPVDPSSTSHTLFNSCVNNVNNPSIYVVFERDQCYPKYLIKYRKAKQLCSVPSIDYLKIGTEVLLNDGKGKGTIRWISPLRRTRTQTYLPQCNDCIGIELDMPYGNNNGTNPADGSTYFQCKPNHGVYVSLSSLKGFYQ